ncbi:helicase-associated domain-containing protein [Cellulomonas sp. PhB143]|uniref:helicase-associated domain-containing protein n=1 Tax=Cellulomonas sp. PhB143 TaxID=2485186 RepID=UPI000F495A9E|nr:helicase-associated domain-containing protein [Cellulomonas sp. PhB143]ROS78754.1 XPB/Ssl2-like helicase family protein [Cellulomonas sp. PhB143]
MPTSRPQPATFGETLRARGAGDLLTLLDARPDLATPAPSTIRSLGARATSRTSVERAVAHLDRCTLDVLEAVLVLGGTRPEDAGTSPDAVVAAVLGTRPAPDDAAAVRSAVADAGARLLVWESAADGAVRGAPGLEEVLGPHPAGLGPTGPAPTGPVGDLLADAPPGAREILAALTWGPPVGVTPRADPGLRAASDWLVAHRLLVPTDARYVVLPRGVGLALREGRTHRDARPRPPRAGGATVSSETRDAEAAGAALESVRLVGALLALWGESPTPVLRSGGLGVRDLRRLARELGTDEGAAASVAELALAAGLVADDGDDPPSFAPTTAADDWLDLDTTARWAALAASWATSARTPWSVGGRDERGTLRAALDPELSRPWVPRLRAAVLAVLAEQPETAPDDEGVLDVLRWRTPRTPPPTAAVAGLLAEAALLGVTGAGALAPTGRALLDDGSREPAHEAVLAPAGPGRVRALAEELGRILPPAVDEVLLQGDLTGIVPGRPSDALATLLDACADVESRGSALTVRFGAPSVTRALGAGRSADELLAALGAHSPVGVPQPLEYLVRDAARRHGSLRVGSASSYLRTEDPALVAGLAQDPALHHLGLFAVAPTVLAAHAPAAELRAALRARGLEPTVEGPGGQVLHAEQSATRLAGRPRPAWLGGGPVRRTRSLRPDPRAASVTAGPSEDPERRRARLAELADRLVAADAGAPAEPAERPAGTRALAPGSTGSSAAGSPPRRPAATHGDGAGWDLPPGGTTEPADSLALLREAIDGQRHVLLEIVGARGTPETRRVRPLRLDAGRLRALDTARDAELTVAVHRIASVRPA